MIPFVCPCCDFPKVEGNACPNCNSDLTLIRKLDDFPGQCLEEGQALLERNKPVEAIGPLGTAVTLDPALSAGEDGITRIQSDLRAHVTQEIHAARPARNPFLAPLAGLVIGAALVAGGGLLIPSPPVPSDKSGKEEPRVQVTKDTPPPPAIYRVRRGDSFWRIAQRQYGTPFVWPQIEEANHKLVTQRGGLFPGDEIRLPALTFRPGEVDKP